MHALSHPDRPRFGTVLTAMVTPFTAEGELDLPGARALARTLVNHGCDGLVLTGTTGEISTLTDEEHGEVFREVLDEVGGEVSVLAGTSTNDTRHSIHLSQIGQEAGLDGVMLVTPYYNKPGQRGIQRHFETVADNLDIPVMLYDIPGRSVLPIDTETLIALAEHPRIVALKDAKGDLVATSRVLAETDLDVYSGEDALTWPLLALGAVGVVSVTAHIAARHYREMIDAARAGDLATARRKHFELMPVQDAVMSHLQGAVATKQLLARAGIIDHPTVRLPLVEPTPQEFQPVLDALSGSVCNDFAENG